MGQTLTNATGLQYAREETPGVLPAQPDWKTLEPNGFGDFGATVTTVPRSPISQLAQRRKGTATQIAANAGYDADQTIDSMVDFTEAFLYSFAVNADMTFRGADTTATGFTIPAATVAQGGKFQFTAAGPISLVYSAGYVDPSNNSPESVLPLTADVLSTDTEIQVAGLVIETAPTNAEVSICGIRAEAGDLALSVAANVGTLSSNNNAAVTPIDFTTLGITIGQKIHVGGLTAANRFGSTAGGSNDSFGDARILAITAQALTLDKLDLALTASDGSDTGSAGALVQVDVLFGRYVRNVSIDDPEFIAISHQFEGSYPNLFETDPPTPVADPDGFEYVVKAYANTQEWAMPLADKSTVTFAFVGTDAEEPVDNASRKTNADTPRLPLFTGAMNTSSDFFRLRIADTDDAGLTSDFKDLTISITNNVSPEYVLGLIFARFVNKGNFELNVTGSALFTNPAVPARIRDNTTVTMDWGLRNEDGAVAVDVPSCTVGDGAKSFPVNESVQIALNVEAFVDPVFGSSMSVSFFPVYPTAV